MQRDRSLIGEQVVKKWLEINFNTGDWVLDLEVVEYFWVKNSHRANLLALKANLDAFKWEVARIIIIRVQTICFCAHVSTHLGHDQI